MFDFIQFIWILDAGACPRPDPGSAGMTNYDTVSKRGEIQQLFFKCIREPQGQTPNSDR